MRVSPLDQDKYCCLPQRIEVKTTELAALHRILNMLQHSSLFIHKLFTLQTLVGSRVNVLMNVITASNTFCHAISGEQKACLQMGSKHAMLPRIPSAISLERERERGGRRVSVSDNVHVCSYVMNSSNYVREKGRLF